MAKSLSLRESLFLSNDEELSDEDEDEDDVGEKSVSGTKQSNLGVTILASRFAANTRRGVEKVKDNVELVKVQKPEEPDFSVDPDQD